MFRRNIAFSLFLCLLLSFASLADTISYQIATPSSQGGLALEFIWPQDDEQCLERNVADEALERLCEEFANRILMLVQVSSDGSIRSQKTLRMRSC